MKPLHGVFVAILVAWPAAAADAQRLKAKPPLPCEQTAATGQEFTTCAMTAARAADQHLNRAYRDLLRYLDPEETARLQAAQLKWIAFRDADCAFWGAGDFELAPANKGFCIADVSERRAKELEEWPPNADRSAVVPHTPER